MIAIAVVGFAASRLMAPTPSTVKELVVVNNSAYTFATEVSGKAGDGWVGLVTAKAHASTSVRDVADQGATWTFRFTAQGRTGGTLQISRDELRSAQWHVQIPDRIAQTLHDAGAPANG